MIRTSTLLLVLAFAGSPAAATLCIAWCDAEAASGDTAATCHHRASEGMPGIQAAEHGCGARLQTEPFVREDVQRTAWGSPADHAVLSADHLLLVPAPDEMRGIPWEGAPLPRVFHVPVLRI